VTQLFAASQYVLLTAAIVGLATAFVLRLAWPRLRHQLTLVEPAQRARWLVAIAAAPLLLSVLQAAVCALPALLGSSWHLLDHGGAHTHGGVAHIPACVSHPPAELGTWPAVLLTMVLFGGLGLRIGGRARAVWRGHVALRGLVAAASPWREAGLHILDIDEPIACIIGRKGTVIVSRALVNALDDRQLAAVLAHERAHGQRSDEFWRAAVPLLLCAQLPTVSEELLVELQLASEQACDEAAARDIGDRLTVAETLVRVERLVGRCQHGAIGAAVAFSGATTSERVKALLDAPIGGPTRLSGRAYVVAATAAAVALTHPMQHIAESVAGLLGS